VRLNSEIFKLVNQVFLIAYVTGFLWLRRNPLSLLFTAISPFSLLFILFVVSHGQYVQFAVAGSLVMALVGYGLALGQDISLYKIEYKMQDVFVASPISPLVYMLGLALSELLYGLPALIVLISLAVFFSTSIAFLPLLLLNVFFIWGTMSSIGFFLSSHMLHMRNATQLISFVNVIIAVVPPVFYPISTLPEPLQIISYFVPTTHASLMLQYSMGFPIPDEWSIYLGLLVQGIYFAFFMLIAKKRALWRET
jgi:ABC-2 type transport system permease protein